MLRRSFIRLVKRGTSQPPLRFGARQFSNNPSVSSARSAPWKRFVSVAVMTSGAAVLLSGIAKPANAASNSATKTNSLDAKPAHWNCNKQNGKHFKYVVVGAGVAGMSAVREIAQQDPSAEILVLNKEGGMPYVRYPLSKELWTSAQNDDDEHVNQQLSRGSFKDFTSELPNAVLLSGTEVLAIEPEKKEIAFGDAQGNTYAVSYESCLLSTGCKPRAIQCVERILQEKGSEALGGRVIQFREVGDYKKLKALSTSGNDIVVVGGGFLGTELANAINYQSKMSGLNLAVRKGKKQRQVTQVIPEPGVLYRVLPLYLSDYTANKMSTHGVDMRTNTLISNIRWVPPKSKPHAFAATDAGHLMSEVGAVSEVGDKGGYLMVELTIRTFGGMRRGKGSAETKWLDVRKYSVKADAIVLAVGVDPASDVGREAALPVDSGDKSLLANAKLEVAPGLFAAGDLVNYYDKTLQTRMRMEHHDHAERTGKHAARNMVLKTAKRKKELKDFTQLSSFWSDLVDLGVHFEAVGNIDAQLNTVGYWNIGRQQFVSPTESIPDYELAEYNKGLVYYLDKRNTVVGVLAWNIKGQLEHAREVLRRQRRLEDPVVDLRDAIPGLRKQEELTATLTT